MTFIRAIHPVHSVTKYLQIVGFGQCNAVLVNATHACLQTCISGYTGNGGFNPLHAATQTPDDSGFLQRPL